MDLHYPYGLAQANATIKSVAEDFEVEEILGFEPGGEGEHLFLWIEKRGLTTAELLTVIAGEYGCHPRQVGHSGLKDKHAVTRQWLSLHLPGIPDSGLVNSGDGYRVLRQLRHHRKLRPGTHKANRFRLRLRHVDQLGDSTRQQMELVAGQGFANYFGQQRFGRNQDNVHQALRQLTGRKISRSKKSMLLSSLRSHLFNQVLATRIGRGHWAQPLEGDVFMLHGSHSVFSEALDENLLRRYAELDISSCASLFGSGKSLLWGDAQAIEQSVLAEHGDIVDCLDRHGSRLQMRALRAIVEEFNYEYDSAASVIDLEFSLPTGSYATSLLDHFFRIQDAS